MYEYLLNYCQLTEEEVYRYQNYPHDEIREKANDRRITRFPIRYYQTDMTFSGIVLWVKDRSGRTIPYINPILLTNMSETELYSRLEAGSDLSNLMEVLLRRSMYQEIPVSFESQIPGVTDKRSYQKKVNSQRKRGMRYDEYQRE